MSKLSTTKKEVEEIYEFIKELEQNNQHVEVKKFLDTVDFPTIWQQLLHHAMMHRNCPVTKRIIIHLINSGVVQRDEIVEKVSEVAYDVSFEFSKKVKLYMRSDEFNSVQQDHSRVMAAAQNQLIGRLGQPFSKREPVSR